MAFCTAAQIDQHTLDSKKGPWPHKRVKIQEAWPTKVGMATSLPTHPHERPVAVHLLGSLEKIAPIRPHGCMVFCDDGCAWSNGT